MSNTSRCLLALGLAACAGEAPTEMNRFPPPTLSVSATTHVLSVADAAPELEIIASLRNATMSPIHVAAGTQCPLFVQLFSSPTGECVGSVNSSMACPLGASAIELAPGDTTRLSRVLGADTLASFAPGTYAVRVTVTTNTAFIGVCAGTIQLPLAPSP